MSRKRHLGAARQQSLKADTYKKSLPPVKLDSVRTNIEGETSSCKLLSQSSSPPSSHTSALASSTSVTNARPRSKAFCMATRKAITTTIGFDSKHGGSYPAEWSSSHAVRTPDGRRRSRRRVHVDGATGPDTVLLMRSHAVVLVGRANGFLAMAVDGPDNG
jgi:hypothetical protein